MGARLHPARSPSRSSSTTPTPATRARSTSGSRARTSSATSSSTSSSSAARTCGSPTSRSPARSTRPSSGGPARGTAATRRSAGCCSRATPTATSPPTGASTPDDDAAVARFEALAAEAPGCISVERSTLGLAGALVGPPRDAGRARRPRASTASLDRRWRRTSYSDITAGDLRGPRRRASRRRPSSTDEPPPRAPPAAAPDDRRRRAARDAVAAGRDAGRRARRHARAPRARGDRLRRAPTSTPSSARAIAPRRRAGTSTSATRRRSSPACARRSRRRSGRCSAASACATCARADRLDELEFELPLAGGDEPTGRLDARRDRAPCCASTCPPATRSPATPSGSTTRRCARRVRGYLTGSIDLVVRLPADGPRFAVVDYKTNWLGAPGRGADRLAPPPGRARGRDGARALRAAGAALHGRAAPLPALARCPATTPSATSPASSTCSCAG